MLPCVSSLLRARTDAYRNVANWSILEPSVCIIAGCLATLRPLFGYFGWTRRSRRSRSQRSRTRKNAEGGIRGTGYLLGPAFMSRQMSRQGHYHGFLRSQQPQSPTIEKHSDMGLAHQRQSLFAGGVYGPGRYGDSMRSRCEDYGETPERQCAPAAFSAAATAGPLPNRHSTVTSASSNSTESIRFSPISSLATPSRPYQQYNRLPQRQSTSSPEQEGLFSGPCSPATPSPVTHGSRFGQHPPPSSPSPCHIFVKKSTSIVYKTSLLGSPTRPGGSTTSSLPASARIPEMAPRGLGGTVNSVAESTLPDESHGIGFHGNHIVKISGPGSRSQSRE